MAHARTRILRPVLALAVALGLSACASVDTASRDAPINAPLTATTDGAPSSPILMSNFKVVQVSVNVPQSLKVSEANRYYPMSDIVWREDPIGDRHAQVKAIVEAGLMKGTEPLQGDREVILKVMVTRFHALTEKARYTIGGVHAIQFYMEVVDAQTGEVLVPSKFVKADFNALGGAAAIESEARGVTQKVRITAHLASVIQQELAGVSYVVEANPVFEAINQI
jgi:hypothetical protein